MKKIMYANSYLALVVTIIFCLYFAISNLGLAFITGSSAYWKVQDSDITQHLSGLNLYLSSAWQFPLLGFDGLNYPTGTRVTFVDGIPILAFLLKLILPRNIGYINPLGYWIALNFVLQGVGAWWITRELQIKSWGFLLYLILTFLSYSGFLSTVILTALMSHWILLFAIALYLRGARLTRLPIIGWTALLFFSFYIHIYLFVMAFGIYVAALLNTKHSLNWRHFFSIFTPLIILTISLFIFLLPLAAGKVTSPQDIAIYGMNVLAPIIGAKLRIFHANTHYSRGGWVNNLGLGVIFLFVWAILFNCSKNIKTCKAHWGILIVFIGYSFFSLSPEIYFNDHLIAKFTYPDFLAPFASQFRGCFRFFWPVAYGIMLFSIYRLYHYCQNKKIFLLLVVALSILQYFDVRGAYDILRAECHQNSIQYFLIPSEVDGAIKDYKVKNIYLYPKYNCFKNNDYNMHIITPMMQYSAMHQLKLNTGFMARYNSNCDDMREEIASSDKRYSIYVFPKLVYSSSSQVYQSIGNQNQVNCKSISFWYICRFKEK